MRRRRSVEVKHRVVLGPKAAVAPGLTACGGQSHTSFVERRNLSLRQRVAAIGSRSATPCQSESGWGWQLALFQVAHHFG